MPFTDHQCPHCDGYVHTDGILDEKHHLGCGEELPAEWCQNAWGGQ